MEITLMVSNYKIKKKKFSGDFLHIINVNVPFLYFVFYFLQVDIFQIGVCH